MHDFNVFKDQITEAASGTHHGQVQYTIEDGVLFSVSSFQGDANMGYVCFQAAKASLSHNGR